MPKNKFQEVIFTIIMVFVMVYAMICYNIVLNTGTMTNETFLLAFHELVFMGPIAFILDFFIGHKMRISTFSIFTALKKFNVAYLPTYPANFAYMKFSLYIEQTFFILMFMIWFNRFGSFSFLILWNLIIFVEHNSFLLSLDFIYIDNFIPIFPN